MPRDVSPKQFTIVEKQLLIDHLCRDCKPVPGGNYPANLAQTPSVDCSEYMDHGLYAMFIKHFVDLLNRTDAAHQKARMSVRRLWEDNGLPKCQMTALCQFVMLGLEADRVPEKDKMYSGYLSDIKKQVETLCEKFGSLRFSLLEEQEFAVSRFSFQQQNKELLWVLDMVEDCLKAAREIRLIRRSNFDIRVKRAYLFVMRKRAFGHAFIPVHKDRGAAEPYDLSRMLPVLHEAIDGRFPDDEISGRYDEENLAKELKRLQGKHAQKKLQRIEQWIEEVLPGALDLNNKDWRNITRAPRKIECSAGCSEILSLSKIHCDYKYSTHKDVFAEKLEGMPLALKMLILAEVNKRSGHA